MRAFGTFRPYPFRRLSMRRGRPAAVAGQSSENNSSDNDNPAIPSGYDPFDSTKLVYGEKRTQINPITYSGGLPASFDSTPTPSTGLTRVPVAQKTADSTKIVAGAVGKSIGQSESSNQLIGGRPAAVTGQSQTVAQPTPNSGGVITRGNGDSVTLFPDKDYSGPTATLRPQPPPPDINHARALGFSTKGTTGPTEEGEENQFTGGVGQYQRKFSNPTSASIYHDFVRNLFSDQSSGQQPARSGFLTKASRPASGESEEDYG